MESRNGIREALVLMGKKTKCKGALGYVLAGGD
jgi:hypothetical protein